MRCALSVLVFLLTFIPASLSAVAAPEVERALINLDFARADRLIEKIPQAKIRAYYRPTVHFLHHLITGSSSEWEAFQHDFRRSTDLISDISPNDPQRNILLAELYFLRGIGKILNDKLISAAIDLKSACRYVERNELYFPDHPGQKKLLGVFQVSMASVPQKYQWLTNALCVPGDGTAGRKHLELARTNADLLPVTAEIVLFYIEKNLDGRADLAAVRADRLLREFPDSPAMAYLKLSAMLELRQVDAALSFCDSLEAVQEREMVPIWHYTRGKAHYFRLDHTAARQRFDRFLELSQGNMLRSDAMFRKGMTLVLEDRYPEARRVFHDIAKLESSRFDEDEYARKMAAVFRFREPGQVEKELFEARNLFDGGYYKRSMALLNQVEKGGTKLSENEWTELFYRRGRNEQGLYQTSAAQQSYENCVKKNPGQSLWMKVYACYYLGQIAEQDHQLEIARNYYMKALSFDDYDYQSGLEQRTKTALERLDGEIP